MLALVRSAVLAVPRQVGGVQPSALAACEVPTTILLLSQAPHPMRHYTPAKPLFGRVLTLLWIPVLLILVAEGAAILYSSRQPVLYEARSEVVVSPGTKFLDPQTADSFPRIATTVQEIALTQVVLQDAKARLRSRGVAVPSLDWLRSHLRLTIRGDTPVLSIAGVAGDELNASLISSAETEALARAISVASAAAANANALTSPAGAETPAKSGGTTSSKASVTNQRGLTLTIFSKGENRGRIQPNPARNALLAGNAGLLLGGFIVALLVSRPPRDEA